jgi:hypothetical protein
LAQRFPLGPDDLHFGGTVTSLPSGVDEGFEVNYIASSSTGVVWRFKYLPTTSATYPWLFIGGPALLVETAGSSTRATNSYGDLAAGGAAPSVTAPLAGEYRLNFGAAVEAGLTAGWRGRVSPDASDASCAYASGTGSAGAGSEGASVSRHLLLATLTASQVVTLKYKSDAANTVNFEKRWVEIVPIRVS